MNIPRVTVTDTNGVHVWTGSATEFLRANEGFPAWELVEALRYPTDADSAIIGGGAAPYFYVSLAKRQAA